MASKKKASRKVGKKKAAKVERKTKTPDAPSVNDLLKVAASRARYNPPPHLKAAIKKVMEENDRRLPEARVKKDELRHFLAQHGHPVGPAKFLRYCEETFGRSFGGGA